MSVERAIATVNAIRQDASDSYLARVPLATLSNIMDVGNPILKYDTIQNEFLNALVCKIAMTIIENKVYTNPLEVFKKGAMPLGASVEMIHTNPVKGNTFSGNGVDSDGKTALNLYTPDVKALYFSLNRQDQYSTSVSNEQLQTAFTSWENVDNLIGSIINALYSGDSIDEFTLMKQLFVGGVETGKLCSEYIGNPSTSESNAKTFVKRVNTLSGLFRFASSNYNKYIEQEGATGEPVQTWVERDNQVIILPTEILTTIDIEVLAFAFNLTKAEFRSRVIEVDSFNNSNIICVICDVATIQVYDNLKKMTEQLNAKGLFTNYFWTHWETLSLSLFSNCVVLLDNETKTVTCEDCTNGSIASDKTSAKYLETVTITATPSTGYTFASCSITDSNGNEVAIGEITGNTCSFKMPVCPVFITAEFEN